MLNITSLKPQLQAAAAHAAAALLSEPARPYTRQPGQADASRRLARKARVTTPADAAKMVLMYKGLKAAGWQSTGQAHPIDKTAVLTLDNATIRRDPDFDAGHWIIKIAGTEYPLSGSPEAITAEVERLLAEAEALPRQLTPAQEEAEGLKAEYPELAARIDAALTLVESGELAGKMAEYGTTWENLTRFGNWVCNCPDSQHRQPVAKFGRACKHCLGGEILARTKRTANRISQQRLASKVEAAVLRGDYASPASYRPAADPINRKASHVYQVGPHLPR